MALEALHWGQKPGTNSLFQASYENGDWLNEILSQVTIFLAIAFVIWI